MIAKQDKVEERFLYCWRWVGFAQTLLVGDFSYALAVIVRGWYLVVLG
jgi:hypothetical protein